MKLQPALIFGEHMVLQRGEPVPVWGRSVRGDRIRVSLGEYTVEGTAEGGLWRVELPPMEAGEGLPMVISSQETGEEIRFRDVAVGEVWLAGGQSNMEFLLKYDEDFKSMLETPEDPGFRFFRYPTANFTGCVEKDAYPDDGFWRTWSAPQHRGMFSGPAAYMGRKLRETLGVPVGIVGVNWGGTPAAAWTNLEDLEKNPALRPVLDWYEKSLEDLDLQTYYAASDRPAVEPSPEERARMDQFMMGIGLEKLFSGEAPPPPPPTDYSPYMPGPRAAIRPAGLYDAMLSQVAPYGIRGVLWYQGEDDDFRGWYGFYDESMKTLISSWRKLWGKELPFLQVELAPFKGRGITGANEYFTMRLQQRAAADALPGVHDVCILDAGDEMNIHVRKKRPVGERLALLARKYVYGENGLLADSPRFSHMDRQGDSLRIVFCNAGKGLVLQGGSEALNGLLTVTADGQEIPVAASVEGDALLLTAPEVDGAKDLRVDFAQVNFCRMPLFNSEGLPAFSFTAELSGNVLREVRA